MGLKKREIRSFVYVEDVVAVLLAAMDRHCCGDRSLWNKEERGLILNVGGPKGLSRLQIAQSLCEGFGGKLHVRDVTDKRQDCQEGSSFCSRDWSVYVMDEVERVETTTVVDKAGELRSPRDIRMDSTITEQLLGVKFTEVEAVLLQCL